ncbi:tRNA(Met) cytidine acetyltransferase TmcA, partial [Haemophilus influenzae]
SRFLWLNDIGTLSNIATRSSSFTGWEKSTFLFC